MMGARIRKVPVLKGEITRLLALIQCRFGVDYWEEVISFHAIGGWVADYVVGHISIGSGYGHSGAVRLGGHRGNDRNGRRLQPAGPGKQQHIRTTVSGTPTAIFYQTFTLAAAASGGLDIWADDTAGVWLDDGIVTAATAVAAAACCGRPTGIWVPTARVGRSAARVVTTLPSRSIYQRELYTLVIDAYQLVGGSPFGVMYDGVMYDGVLNTTVPEPASYRLMGLGLAGLGTLIRHR